MYASITFECWIGQWRKRDIWKTVADGVFGLDSGESNLINVSVILLRFMIQRHVNKIQS